MMVRALSKHEKHSDWLRNGSDGVDLNPSRDFHLQFACAEKLRVLAGARKGKIRAISFQQSSAPSCYELVIYATNECGKARFA